LQSRVTDGRRLSPALVLTPGQFRLNHLSTRLSNQLVEALQDVRF